MFKKLLHNFIAKHLFKMVTEKDFIKINSKGEVFIGSHKLSKGEIEGFSKAAKDLMQNDAYVLIMREMWTIGEKKVFFEGGNDVARAHGMSVLWVLDLIIKKVENLARLK